MTRQRIRGTREQQADLNERIPASEFRQFMQEMREFKKETNQKFDALIQTGNDRDQQLKQILDELGKLRKDSGE